jgi:capsule polysaccharide export protein KpsC/LpsZ
VPGRLHFDERAIPLRSLHEAELVTLLQNASIEGDSRSNAEHNKRLVLSSDISDYLAATDDSPAAALALLVRRVLAFVSSDDYVAVAREIRSLAPYAWLAAHDSL